MFRAIRYRLLFSYLAVLASILSVFAYSVHTVFAQSLINQLSEDLTAIATAATRELEFHRGKPVVESDFSVKDLDARGQALQWFDLRGNVLVTYGKLAPTTHLSLGQPSQVQTIATTTNVRLLSITLKIVSDKDGRQIGYVRASQSLKNIDATIERLNWGLGTGILLALLFIGIGGVWLVQQSMQPIESSYEQLQQFTADASHELRSPLTAIKNNAAVALKYPEGMRNSDREKFAAIASAAQQIAQLTDDLLFLARTDNLRVDKTSNNLRQILTEVIEQLKPQIEAKSLEISQFWADIFVCGDACQLSRLFRNLLENAIQYTPVGGKISVKLVSLGQFVLVEIQDTGIGIANSDLNKIFDRFWRADYARSYYSGGSGLGLAIAKAIVKQHRGDISVSSQVNKGTIFTVRLPEQHFTSIPSSTSKVNEPT